MNCTPCTRMLKGWVILVLTLAGSSEKINGPLPTVTAELWAMAAPSSLVARIVTVLLGDGGVAGARYSIGPAIGPAAAWHGLLPGRQITPRLSAPLGNPFTSHETFWSGLPTTVARKACVPVGGTVALGGESVTANWERTVKFALPNCTGSAMLTAVTVTAAGVGTVTGAR